MDYRVLLAMAEAAVGWERQRIRQMERSLRADDAALQEKERELEMLKKNKVDMLAFEAATEKLVHDFMGSIEAIEKNDPEIALNFDEKAMMNAILTMMKNEGSDYGGIVGGDIVPKIELDVAEKPTRDATLAMNNSDSNSGGKFVGDNGGINNASQNADTLGEGGTMVAIQGTIGDGTVGSAAAGIGDSCSGKAPLIE